ncbi:hypothetical protein ACE1TF_16050 [Geomicrobium sp. JSM 1781026]|uniref:hypothetical protein n=1 Tax=Geomicrobium sp. JSM 1781026 TaxID=3344580 RepID=UPI0035C16C1B
MGFWYFLLLLVGMASVIMSLNIRTVSREVKLFVILFFCGGACTILALVMFLPGASEIIAIFLDVE